MMDIIGLTGRHKLCASVGIGFNNKVLVVLAGDSRGLEV